MPVELASAYVSIIPTTKGIAANLEKELVGPVNAAAKKAGDEAGETMKRSLSDTGKSFTNFGIGALAVAGGIGLGLSKVGGAASDLNESINAVNVTFGASAEGVLQLGKDAATSMGLSNAAFNGLAVQFSAFATTIAGKGGDVVGTLQQLTGRAADFASVMNIDVADAAQLFQSGLAGETEPLRKYGLDLSAAAVNAYAAANGIGTLGADLTEAEKVTARYGLLMQSTSVFQGDFANTADGAANAMRIAKADMDNAAASLGTSLMPIMADAAGIVGGLAERFTGLNEATDGWLAKGAAIAAVALGAVGGISLIIGQAIKMKERFGVLNGVLHNTEGGLSRLGKAAVIGGIAMGVAGLAVIAATAVYDDNATKKARLIDLTNEFTDALKREADGQKGAVEETVAGMVANQQLIDQAAKLGLSVSDLADIVNGKTVPAYEKLKEQSQDMTGPFARNLSDWNEHAVAISKVEQAIDPMTQGLKGAKDQMELASEVQTELTGATHSWGLELPTAAEMADKAAASTEGLSVAQIASKGAVEGIAAATEEATRKSKIFADSLQAQLDKLNELYPKQYDAVQAKYDFRDAVEDTMLKVADLDTTLGDHKATQDDVRSATNTARDAIIDQATKFATLDGAAAGSEGAIRRQISSLEAQRDSLAPGSPLRAFLDEYIADLKAIPSNISTIMDLHISSGQVTTNQGDFIGRKGIQARGGPGGGVTLVGEEGPELVNLPTGSYVHTAQATRSLTAAGLMGAAGGSIPPIAIHNYRRDIGVADLNHVLAMARLAA